MFRLSTNKCKKFDKTNWTNFEWHVKVQPNKECKIPKNKFKWQFLILIAQVLFKTSKKKFIFKTQYFYIKFINLVFYNVKLYASM
jgi:hypothetical protein